MENESSPSLTRNQKIAITFWFIFLLGSIFIVLIDTNNVNIRLFSAFFAGVLIGGLIVYMIKENEIYDIKFI